MASSILNNKSAIHVEGLLIVDLANNRLEKLPETLGQLIQLKTLLLNDNFLKDLDNTIISKLVKLETLIVRNNILVTLNIVKSWSRTLKSLDVSQNHLKVIPY